MFGIEEGGRLYEFGCIAFAAFFFLVDIVTSFRLFVEAV